MEVDKRNSDIGSSNKIFKGEKYLRYRYRCPEEHLTKQAEAIHESD
jgi:hypothetical protein